MAKKIVNLALGLLVFLVLVPALTFAEGRSGVLVLHSDGSIKKFCAPFEGTDISSFDLLRKAAFNPILDRSFLVEIDGERAKSGWDQDAANDYWSFWELLDGKWQYSKVGVVSSRAKDGQVDGWQRGGSALKLPTIQFSDVCPEIKENAPQLISSISQNAQPAEQVSKTDPPKQNDPKKTLNQEPRTSSVTENNLKEEATSGVQVKKTDVKKNQEVEDNKNKKFYVTALYFLMGLFFPFLIKR